MSQTEQTTIEWCAGLPLVQQRPIDASERESLKKESRALRRRGVGVIVLFVSAVSLFALAAAHTNSSADNAQTALAIAAIMLTALGLPVTILLVRESLP